MNGLLFPLMLANVSLAFRQSAMNGKVITILLILISIGAWTVLVTKFTQLRLARLSSIRFLRAFHEQARPTNLFIKKQRMPDAPLNAIYEAGCRALINQLSLIGINPEEGLLDSIYAQDQRRIDPHQMDTIQAVVDCALADAALDLESHMGLLSTAVSVGPFLGLLGTVWGVMGTFSGMAIAGSATLSAVAPGISGALLTTVVGLLVALPSSIGYSLLATRIRHLSVQMDNFAQEFTGRIQQEFMLNYSK
jgi:biopolymer transport protein ExbB/TolQ